jgi:ATP adenylyltransferase
MGPLLHFLAVERLWTPWRKAFIESTAGLAPDGCFLCALQDGDDRANLVLYRAEHGLVLLNLYPYNSGHLMIAPYTHTGDLATLEASVAAELMHLTQRCVAELQAEYQPHGFNVGMNLGRPAGAGVPDHLHVHVVPRWNGDTNFMPIVGETKVLPETLEQTYERLEPRFH